MGLFNLFKKKNIISSPAKKVSSQEEYLQQKVGDKTIKELQAEAMEERINRNFKIGTPVYEGLHIFSNVYPAKEGYDTLNDVEKAIFKTFVDLCKENDIKYDKIRMIRQGKKDIVVDHPNCWAGRFLVKQKAPKYDIYPIGSGKRKRVGKTMEEAECILKELGEGFEVRVRIEEPLCNLTVSNSNPDKIKFYENITVEELLMHLPEMIQYIKRCQKK